MESSLADVKRLQYLIDQTSRACHMLDLNATVMKTLMSTSKRHLEDETPAVTMETGFQNEVQSI